MNPKVEVSSTPSVRHQHASNGDLMQVKKTISSHQCRKHGLALPWRCRASCIRGL